MSRLSRTLPLLVIACVAASTVIAAPAVGQIDPGRLGELERRRDQIVEETAALGARLGELELEIDELEEQADIDRIRIELVADDIERAVHARREPEATRVKIAIVGFTQGDPRHNALLDEVRTLEGDEQQSQRRILYQSVIEETTQRLDSINRRLIELDSSLDLARERLADTAGAIELTREELTAVGNRRTQLGVELQETLEEIERLKALESKALLTGLATFESQTRPAIAVKIDNVPNAWPQAGINQADLVFVELVEGDLTRLAAVFHSLGASEVGPVRSMRTGDFDLLAQFNAPLFSNSGGNRYTQRAILDSTLVDVGVNVAFEHYYRDRGRRAPHNLMTNTNNLWLFGSGLGGAGSPSPLFRFRTADEGVHPAARAARSVTVEYGRTTVGYEWNGSSWDRTQDGVSTVDTAGVRVSPETVVVHFTDYGTSPADPNSPEAITLGSGPAWIFTDGHVVDAVWRRAELTDQFEYVNAGTEVRILPGRTWIEMPRRDRASFS